MSIILFILIGLWLLKAALDVFIGLIQIIVGLIGVIFGCLCMSILFLIKVMVVLCQVAFSSAKH
jgi:hypothetical protein